MLFSKISIRDFNYLISLHSFLFISFKIISCVRNWDPNYSRIFIIINYSWSCGNLCLRLRRDKVTVQFYTRACYLQKFGYTALFIDILHREHKATVKNPELSGFTNSGHRLVDIAVCNFVDTAISIESVLASEYAISLVFARWNSLIYIMR